MSMYEGSTVEQGLELKDGRKLFKTDNGFKSFVVDKKGIISPVTSAYYNKSKHHKIGTWVFTN